MPTDLPATMTVMAIREPGGPEVLVRREMPLPPNLPMVEAAAIRETFFTVWHNVFERGRLGAGERLLVHGGSSGTALRQLRLERPLAPG